MRKMKWIATALVIALLCTTAAPVFAETTETGSTTEKTCAEYAKERLVALDAYPSAMTSKARMAALKKAFLWSAKLGYINNTRKKLSASQALEYYGKYGFTKMRGDCNTKAATFCWMAKALGYNAKMIRGYVPRAKKGNKYSKFRAHSWVEIKIGKKKYGFDPEFNRSSDAKKLRKKNKYVGFKFRYRQKGTYAYHSAKKKLKK